MYRQPLPLRGFDMDLRESLVEALGAQGIALHPGCRPQKLEADGDERVLTFGEGHALRTDLVFFATGRAPATKGLGLDKVGVSMNEAGAVVVDQHLRTSQHHIYAMGDVTDRLNLTPVAIAEGHALADTSVRQEPARHLAAQCADSGVLHAADRHLSA